MYNFRSNKYFMNQRRKASPEKSFSPIINKDDYTQAQEGAQLKSLKVLRHVRSNDSCQTKNNTVQILQIDAISNFEFVDCHMPVKKKLQLQIIYANLANYFICYYIFLQKYKKKIIDKYKLLALHNVIRSHFLILYSLL